MAQIKVEGLRELGAKFEKLSEDMQKRASRNATGVAAGVVEQTAQALVPVRTGLLKSQIITKRIPAGQAAQLGLTSAHIVTVRQGSSRRKRKKDLGSAPHAHLVEYGTVKMAAQPFLRPALDQNVSPATDAIKQVLRKSIEDAAK